MSNPAAYEFPHPYAYEIENLTYSENQLGNEGIDLKEPTSLKNELKMITTEE